MSPLTKILIVLLTVASVALCAMVVSYVASADNYKGKYEQSQNDLKMAKQKEQQANEDLKSAKASFGQTESNLQKRVTELNNQFIDTSGKLSEAERERARLLEEQDKYKTLADSFQKTMEEQGKLLKNNMEELDKVRAEGVKLEKELNETSNALIEEQAIVDSLEKKIKHLEEEKAELLARLNEPLRPFGREATPARPVTRTREAATAPIRETPTVTLPVRDIDLKAVVKAVDMKNSMASVSVGSADGVTEGMRFHVTRGSQFICDIVIISVDVEEAVGVLELVQQQPMIGDNASTNF
ncbi:MAG: hypothetical protein JW804_06715 [Sedimentisphaerales bacterium]|nr:hypothetical protein [Sedimentisphaerales bacterium]